MHAAEDNTIRLALIGCGGRGSGAVANAMNSAHGPVKLVAMADVVEDRLDRRAQGPEQAVRRSDRRAQGAAVRRLRRLQEGHRLPRPQRRGHADQLRLLPPDATGIRREEGRERLHGEVVRPRRAGLAAADAGRRRGGEEEPQDRRRPAVPPQREPPGADQADPRRRNSATSNSSGPTACIRSAAWARSRKDTTNCSGRSAISPASSGSPADCSPR